MLRSMARYKRRRPPQTDILPPIFFEGEGEYLMRIYIGSPPVQTWAIPDTGSDLIWIQCLPCHACFPQNTPIFNPLASSTYKIVSCHSKPCRSFFDKGGSGCGGSTQCVYGYGYADGSTTSGELARDLFSLGGKSDDSFKKPLLLGCGHNNRGQFSRKGSGLVGLGGGPLSLVSQLGREIDRTFSYCLVPFFSKSRGKLKLGKDSKISGSRGAVSTPFVTDDSFKTNYYLTLEGITIGNKTLKTGPKRKGNTLIDSGATYFLMETRFYTKVEALINKAVRIKEVRNPPDPFTLCYPNKYSETIKKRFPKFVVHFEGADIALKPDQNIFFRLDNLLCLAILPSDQFDYGSLPQINFQVEYNLKAKKISFAHADCGEN
ncbi:aspartic proteinase CDR1-like [Neltuma alba]|uniref:aspartic proteinase CDR1-like n=1 Tax=Neltuma alba TaxID=207710 RepID=UPI0010A333E0|nr:aspartic proteinase CDR1-like [Prosopis alba]